MLCVVGPAKKNRQGWGNSGQNDQHCRRCGRAGLAAPLAAHAAGLGRLTVLSALGQPLSAEIEIVSLQPGEEDAWPRGSRRPRRFAQAGIEFEPGAHRRCASRSSGATAGRCCASPRRSRSTSRSSTCWSNCSGATGAGARIHVPARSARVQGRRRRSPPAPAKPAAPAARASQGARGAAVLASTDSQPLPPLPEPKRRAPGARKHRGRAGARAAGPARR